MAMYNLVMAGLLVTAVVWADADAQVDKMIHGAAARCWLLFLVGAFFPRRPANLAAMYILLSSAPKSRISRHLMPSCPCFCLRPWPRSLSSQRA